MDLAIVTTATRSYVPLARVLMASVAEHHPEARAVVLQVDGPKEGVAGAEVLVPADLISDERELTIRAGLYGPVEYTTALKPQLMLHALETADRVIFLDPDMRLFQPMSAALEALDNGCGTLFTPHRLTPPMRDDWEQFEWESRVGGVFNTGFVGVTKASVPFLEWWAARLRRHCLVDAKLMQFVDQRIVELAPSYFEVDQLKDPAYNVGSWNLEERTLRRDGSVWMINDAPLVLMHYSGVRPGGSKVSLPYTHMLPAYMWSDRVAELGDLNVAVGEIEQQYIADLTEAGLAELSRVAYEYRVTPTGRVLTAGDRRRYRRRVLAAEASGATPPLPDDVLGGMRTRIDHGVDAIRDALKRSRARSLAEFLFD